MPPLIVIVPRIAPPPTLVAVLMMVLPALFPANVFVPPEIVVVPSIAPP
ncbi:MAG: hypothetical protein FWE95_04295 [Planctomycetaceae bacterium]|nr:hypothetical protein [Planctomycetaceae bacterium]